MTNASARPPRFPSVLYDLGRLACTFQMSCRCSGPLGRVAPHLPTRLPLVLQIRLIPEFPACLQLGSQLFPICKCSLSFGLHLPPTCLPTSHSMLWMLWAAWFYACPPLVSNWAPLCLQEYCGFWAAQFYTYVPLVSHLSPTVSQYAVGALHFSRTVDTLDVLCRMNLRLSPPCLSYCLQISCGCSGLQEATLVSLLSSTVSQYAVVWVL